MMYNNPLPGKLADLVNAELKSGERVVWAGQPVPGRFARRSLRFVLFAIPWTAFALFWVAGASGFKMPDFSHGPGLFPLFGVPFVLIGCGMLSSPLWMRRKARRTAYVITNRRALIMDAGVWGTVTMRSFEPHRLGDLRRVQHADGSGDLVFDRTWASDGDGGRQSTDHGFLAIENVKAVEEKVMELARA